MGNALHGTIEESKQFAKEHSMVWIEIRGLLSVNIYIPQWHKAIAPNNEMNVFAYLPELRAEEYNVLWRTWSRIPTDQERIEAQWKNQRGGSANDNHSKMETERTQRGDR